MNINEYFEAGYFLKPHGFKGSIAFHQSANVEISYELIDHIILSVNNLFTPFFIEKIDHKGKLIFKLEGINTEIEAKKLQSKKVYVSNKFKTEIKSEKEFDLIDYTVIDLQRGSLGKIKRIEEMPNYTILVVEKDDKEILLPNNENFIIDINHELKLINYNAPEGLISLYLD